MITKPTVLILGAGASRPYGFPLGTELSRKIIENLRNSNSAEFSALQMMDFDADYIKDFVNSFQSSFQTSIDAFLEHREDCIQIGRVAIAQVIIPHENVMNLIDAKAEDDWYKYLFKRMNASFDDFGDNGLSVMTYNYDRSFEHFVFTALKNTHNKTDTQVADKLSSIPIIHLHGRLGALPWEQYYGQYYCRSYSPSASSGDLRNSAEGIKIIYQDIESSPEFNAAKQILAGARCVVFLGFGFDDTNLERILPCISSESWVFGSVLGFTAREKGFIEAKFPKNITLGDTRHNALEFLRDLCPFDLA